MRLNGEVRENIIFDGGLELTDPVDAAVADQSVFPLVWWDWDRVLYVHVYNMRAYTLIPDRVRDFAARECVSGVPVYSDIFHVDLFDHGCCVGSGVAKRTGFVLDGKLEIVLFGDGSSFLEKSDGIAEFAAITPHEAKNDDYWRF